MEINKLLNHSEFTLINNPKSLDKVVKGIFSCDLLSHVMANATEDNILITILNNINVLGVVSLLDLSCVVFSHNINIQEGVIQKADELDIALLKTSLSTAEAVILLSNLGV